MEEKRKNINNSMKQLSLSSQKLKRKYPPEADCDDWGLTPQEQDEKVEELRLLLVERGVWHNNIDFYMLLRFLRAREYVVEKALSMFLDHLQWRQENRVDHILNEFHFSEREEFLSIYPQGYHKTDKLGHPIYIQHLGRVDLAKIREITTDERMINYHVQEYERCFDSIFTICSKLQNRQIDKSFAIIDLKGLGLYHFTSDVRTLISTVTKIDQDNYPETLYHTCIINAPAAFRFIWRIVKPMLNQRTQDKVEVCPSDFLPSLKVWIDEDSIPEYLGGKSKGTLLDDIGPWNNPELISELKNEKKTESENLKKNLKSEPSDKTIFSTQASFSSVYQDPETSSSFESSFVPDTNLNSNSLRRSSIKEDKIEIEPVFNPESIELVDPPERTRSPSNMPNINNHHHHNEKNPKPRPLAERILELEEIMPSQIQRLRSHLPRGTIAKLKSNPKQSLISRVEVLEEGMSLLLSAQEVQWRNKPKENRSFCDCCTIM